jgi:predicted NodU family carbamoyl transferase
MQSALNLKIKYRESFRPFAPAVLREDRVTGSSSTPTVRISVIVSGDFTRW